MLFNRKLEYPSTLYGKNSSHSFCKTSSPSKETGSEREDSYIIRLETKSVDPIQACISISRDKAGSEEDYQRQVKALILTLAAAAESELSVSLIKEMHSWFSPPPVKRNIYASPEASVGVGVPANNIPGKFRNDIVGTSPKETLTEAGISEILTILEEESTEGFAPANGTWIGPLNTEKTTISLSESLCHANLAEKLRESKLSKSEFVKKIHADAQERAYVILFPRNTTEIPTIEAYMEHKMAALIEKFNKDLCAIYLGAYTDTKLSADDVTNQKKQLIVAFIKRCIRLHPFGDANHRVFALGVLNFLFLKNDIGFCPLGKRRIFSTTGLTETLKDINITLLQQASLLESPSINIEKRRF